MMSEVASINTENIVAEQEKSGLLEFISANIKKITTLVQDGIKKVFGWSFDTTKQLLDWAIPDSPVKNVVKSMTQEPSIPKESLESPPLSPAPTPAPKPEPESQPAPETTQQETANQQQAA
ncbi:MAG TPA: hypothetical protein PKA32_01425 [Candidatus Gracilibacteria bacterium]|nr:hypothetical protein [Candidatus Gracilibacteria bacterium]